MATATYTYLVASWLCAHPQLAGHDGGLVGGQMTTPHNSGCTLHFSREDETVKPAATASHCLSAARLVRTGRSIPRHTLGRTVRLYDVNKRGSMPG